MLLPWARARVGAHVAHGVCDCICRLQVGLRVFRMFVAKLVPKHAVGGVGNFQNGLRKTGSSRVKYINVYICRHVQAETRKDILKAANIRKHCVFVEHLCALFDYSKCNPIDSQNDRVFTECFVHQRTYCIFCIFAHIAHGRLASLCSITKTLIF